MKHSIRLVHPVAGLVVLLLLTLLVSACGQDGASGSVVGGGGTAKQPGVLSYVAIGASDTFGFGTSDPYNDNWPTDLAGKFNGKVHLVNLGVPSIHVHQALTMELPVALDVHPDLVTIWLAINDLADHVPVPDYEHDLSLLISRLQAGAPRVRIAIANVPDLTLLPHFSASDPVARPTARSSISPPRTSISPSIPSISVATASIPASLDIPIWPISFMLHYRNNSSHRFAPLSVPANACKEVQSL